MAFGPTELILIAVVVILLFGANKIPQLGRSAGRTVGEFRKGRAEAELELREMEAAYRRRRDGAERGAAAVDTHTDLTRVQKMALSMGIDIRGKSEDQLLKEMERRLAK